MDTIKTTLDHWSAVQPGHSFLVVPERGEYLSYAVLRRHVQHIGAGLNALGVHAGDKAAYLLDNGPWTALLFLGIMYSGRVAVPISAAASTAQQRYMLEHSGSRVLFVATPYQLRLQAELAQMETPPHLVPAHPAQGIEWPVRVPFQNVDAAPTASQPALLIYTSGTTGRPKGVLLSHANLLAGARNTIQAHHLNARDRALCVLPLYHINGQIVTVAAPLRSGGGVLMPSGFDAARFWQWLADYQGTWFSVVPTLISTLLERPACEFRKIPGLRFGRSASAPLPPALHKAFEERFGVRIVETMGLTETAAQILSNPLPPARGKYGSPGLPVVNEAKVAGPGGAELPPGETGELMIRGPNVMLGYYKDPAATREALDPGGWLHTGDLAWRDGDGYFFIAGRIKELIIRGGENISPREIDDVLYEHPAVLEAAAFAVEDARYGQEAAAAVVAKPGMKRCEAELIDFCRARLGYIKSPKWIHFVGELPKGPSGKIRRIALQPAFEAHTPNVDTTPAREELEQKLLDQWRTALHLPNLGIHADFFACGGDSVRGAALLSGIAEDLNLELHLVDLFDAPSVAEFADQIRLQLERHAAIENRRLRSRPRNFAQGCMEFPLAPEQRRLWVLMRLTADSIPAHNIPVNLCLRGELQVKWLRRALEFLVARHETLRTAFRERDGTPVQAVHAELPELPLVVQTAEAIPEPDLDSYIRSEAAQAFDLTALPLWRARLLRLEDHRHVLLLTVHHLVFDGWSVNILVRELAAVYRALSFGAEPHLPPLPLQYADLAAARAQPPAAKEQAALVYWGEQLEGSPPLLELPADHPRPPLQSFRGASVPCSMGEAFAAQLGSFSRIHGVTPFMTLLAGFAALLGRYTRAEDFLIGVPVSERSRPETEHLLGFVVNTLPLRIQIGADCDFLTLLGQVKQQVLQAHNHQDIIFEQLQGSLGGSRTLSHTALFQVLFIYQPLLPERIAAGGLEFSLFPRRSFSAKYDLTWWLAETEHGFHGYFEYNSDLFESATIERFAGHLRQLVNASLLQPRRSLASLPLLGDNERSLLLEQWNATHAPFPSLCLPQWFESQVERMPDAVALQCFQASAPLLPSPSGRGAGGEGTKGVVPPTSLLKGEELVSLSYRQLNRRANRLAHHLRHLGVRPETAVGIYLERKPELVVALLAVLKSGGFYVPLDPHYPSERLRFILEQAEVSWIVSERAHAEELPDTSAQLICLDEAEDVLAAYEAENPHPLAEPGNLAYTIYTSGSTGQPKGVQIEHRGVVNLLATMQHTPGFQEGWNCLAVTTVAFDMAVVELYLPLVSGGTVHLLSRERVVDGRALVHALDTLEPDFMQATTATWRLLLASGWNGTPGLHILCGGEAMDLELAAQLQARAAKVWNIYGPTEITVWATCRAVDEELPDESFSPSSQEGTDREPLERSDNTTIFSLTPPPLPRGEGLPSRGHTIPIGRPLGNIRVYVLDPLLQPVPVGVTGELYITGVGVARQYLERPDLNATSFVDLMLVEGRHERAYKTGDLVRWRADGVLEYLERTDFQVKLRGFRIELGEIEAVLAAYPGIRQCAVLLREDRPGEPYLAAYYACGGAPPPAREVLQAYLREHLADYMLPAAYVALPELCLTPNGKIDRRALPAADPGASAGARAATPPRTATEKALAQLWQETLGLIEVDIHADFFASGGHSFSALRLAARIEQAFGRELPLRVLFERGSIAELALYLEDDAGTADPVLIYLRPNNLPEVRNLREVEPLPLFCVHPIGGGVTAYLPLAERLERPCYGLQALGIDPGTQPLDEVSEMAARYLAALRTVQTQGPYHLCGWSFGGVVAFEMARQLRAAGDRVGLIALLDSKLRLPAELTEAELQRRFRIDLYRLAGYFPEAGTEFEDADLDAFTAAAIRAEVVPAATDAAHVARLFTVFCSHYRAWHSYIPQPYDGPVEWFYSAKNTEITTTFAEWEAFSTCCRRHEIAGDHYALLQKDQVMGLTKKLAAILLNS